MALDESKDNDVMFREDGLVLLGDDRVRQEVESHGGLRIDFFQDRWRGTGFAINLTGVNSSCC